MRGKHVKLNILIMKETFTLLHRSITDIIENHEGVFQKYNLGGDRFYNVSNRDSFLFLRESAMFIETRQVWTLLVSNASSILAIFYSILGC